MIESLEQPVEKQVSCRCRVPFWNHAVEMERHDALHALHALEAFFFVPRNVHSDSAYDWLSDISYRPHDL
jgi:hypothetical protein